MPQGWEGDLRRAPGEAESSRPTKKRRRDNPAASSQRTSPSSREDATTQDCGICSFVSARYEKLSRIGQGTYGIVYQARDRRTGRLVALKKCIPHNVTTDGFPLTTLRELTALRVTCRGHDNIVQLLDVTVSAQSVFLVLEHCEHDLGHLIDKHYDRCRSSPFDHAAAKGLTQQLLAALHHIHSHHYIHRDIKLSNLLYASSRGLLKVADFGLARSYPSHTGLLTQAVASLWYRPPELLFPMVCQASDTDEAPIHDYTQSLDLWAAACVYCELMLGAPPMNGRSDVEQVRMVLDFVGLPPTGQRPSIYDALPLPVTTSPRAMLTRFSFLTVHGLRFLTGLLDYDPRKRWTARQALDCQYLCQEDPRPTPAHQMPTFGAQRVAVK